MSRDEILDRYETLANLTLKLGHQGDFDAHAATIRKLSQLLFDLYGHVIPEK